jgi:hypothetical protein
VDRLYDAGKLEAIRNAQVRLHEHINAQENQFIANAPMAQVNAHIRATRPVGPEPNILPATPADSQRIDSAIEERMLAQIKPKSAQSFEPLSGEAERDFLTDATTDEMKSYFERKYPGGARRTDERPRYRATRGAIPPPFGEMSG